MFVIITIICIIILMVVGFAVLGSKPRDRKKKSVMKRTPIAKRK